MRAIFALVLTTGVAAGAALLMWDDGDAVPAPDPVESGAAKDSVGPAAPGYREAASELDDGGAVHGFRRLSNTLGASGAGVKAAPNATVANPARADAVAATMRGHLAEDRADLAARAILPDESGVLASADVRSLALRTADALVRSAESVSGAKSTSMRIDARRLYAAIYDSDAATASELEHAFDGSHALNRMLVMGAAAPDAVVLRYKFQSGDSLWKLSRGPWKAAGVTAEAGFILHVNGISDARRIRAGQTLRIPKERVSLLIRKSRRTLTLMLGGAPFAEFPVGIGADDSTPEGVFSIATKIENPDWYYGGKKIPYGDPQNVIGTRWMGFTGDIAAEGIGIHGTSDETTVGQAVSLGCIRMRRVDVETLFEWVSRGTDVDVRR